MHNGCSYIKLTAMTFSYLTLRGLIFPMGLAQGFKHISPNPPCNFRAFCAVLGFNLRCNPYEEKLMLYHLRKDQYFWHFVGFSLAPSPLSADVTWRHLIHRQQTLNIRINHTSSQEIVLITSLGQYFYFKHFTRVVVEIRHSILILYISNLTSN